MEVANRFVDQARAYPRRSLSAAIKQIGRLNANAQTIPSVTNMHILIHPKAGNGAGAPAGDGDGGRVGGAGDKGEVGLAAARNSGIDRSDVFGVGAGKQGRKRQQLVVRAVGVVDVAAVAPRINEPRVSSVIVSAASNAVKAAVGGRAAAGENPESLVGGAVLARIDVDEQLRLALFQ